MKKYIAALAILILASNSAFAVWEPQYKEEKLDLKSLTPEELQQVKKDREYQEKLQMNMQQEGQDYMYRMQQQMMVPQNMNPFGGYRY